MKLAVFGNPVKHSLSPRIHRLFAAQCGLEVDYQAIEASTESFPDRVAGLAASGGRGCNITAPFKHDAWKLAQRHSDSASRAQAANTLVFEGVDDWFADSTDGQGLVNDLLSMPGKHLQGSKICLLGAGGAAASVLGALLRARPASVLVANRTPERARQLAQTHSDLGAVAVCTPDDIGSHGPFDWLINATSAGHSGGAVEITPAWLEPGGVCYDLNYATAAEPLRSWCLEKKIPYSDGLGMLVGQAALSFSLWTGMDPDTAEVLRELRDTAR